MSTFEKINAKPRERTGSTASRRLRTEGIVPANLYGHKQGAVAIQVEGDEVRSLIKDGAKVFDLELNGEAEKVLLKDVQWDTFSKHVMHVDFLRVDANERVHVEVPVVLRGTAPGVLAGGVLEQAMHTLEVECLAVEIPDNIQVKVGSLNIGQSIHVNELTDLPKGVQVVSPEDSVVVQVAEVRVVEEEPAAEGADAGAEPEVIGKDKEE